MENEQKLYYIGREVVREIDYNNSMCEGCIANRTDGICGIVVHHAGDEYYYCTDSENEYVFKFKENVE
jgi:hypothetical protein